jgi:FkbM family methyltransferase
MTTASTQPQPSAPPEHAPPASSAAASAQARAEAVVHGLYRGFLGRAADGPGLQYWTGAIAAGATSDAVLQAILTGDEYRQKMALDTRRARIRQALATYASTLPNARTLTIVDVGAQELEDEQHVYAPLCNAGLAHRIIGFEPLQDKLDASRLRNPDGRITLYPTFIGDGGHHVFHINAPDATSSLLPLNQDLIGQLVDLSHLRTTRTETVGTSTLDAVLDKQDVPHVDFLKLDIQGFELPALQHASAVLARTNVVHCEVSFAEIYQGQALFSEVETLLRGHGFYFVDFSSTCHYPYHCGSHSQSRDRLGWGDAVFFKAPQRLASPDDLLAQCLIAQLIYDKDSLAEALAERYDQLVNDGDPAPTGALAALFASDDLPTP